jgi:hypothetical protein
MGAAVGMCPKARIFAQYIEMEMSLREFDRARMLYQKYLEVRNTPQQDLEVQIADQGGHTVRSKLESGMDHLDNV